VTARASEVYCLRCCTSWRGHGRRPVAVTRWSDPLVLAKVHMPRHPTTCIQTNLYLEQITQGLPPR
jgi:hypothetical protein